MLSCNLWVQSGLVTGALRVVMKIIYTLGSSPPKLPAYVFTTFDNYIWPPWDQYQPKHIHKSKGLALTRSTIGIGNTKR